MGISHLRRLDHLCFGDIRPAVGYVAPHGIVKQKGLLTYHADLSTQGLQGRMANIHPIDRNLSLGYIIEPRQEVYQSSLPRPTGAYQGHLLPALHRKIDFFQNHLITISEGDIVIADLPSKGRESLGIRGIGHFWLEI